MAPRSLLLRLVLPFAVLMACIVGICGVVVLWAGQRQARRQQIHDLDGLAPLVQRWVMDDPSAGRATRDRLREAAQLLETRITLIDGDGRVTFDSHWDASRMDIHNARPEVRGARARGSGAEVRHSDTLGEESVYVARLVYPDQPEGLVLRLSYPQHTWADLGSSAWGIVAGSVVAAVLALVGLWLVLNQQWIAPTRQLAAVAQRLADGDWNRRAVPEGAEEMRDFSTRLNLVATHAQKQMSDLSHQRADLQSLVDTLPDPILVCDAGGTVTLVNSAAARLLDLAAPRVMGQAVVKVVNDEAVLQLLDRVGGADGVDRAATGEAGPSTATPADPGGAPALTSELRLHRGGQWFTYQAVATRTADGGVLLVLRDVSALAAAVRMKTDFVANASHELRTPIAAIKIAFETLREVYDDDVEQSDRCMRIIDGHLHRLEEMLRDLLDMAKVEESSLKPHVRRIRTIDLFAQIRASLGPMARQKGVDLRLGGAGDEEPAAFHTDERLLNLVLKNLIENAIKFTPPGGSVALTVSETRSPRPRGVAVVAPDVGDDVFDRDPTAPAAFPPRIEGMSGAESHAALLAALTATGAGNRPVIVISVADTGIGIPPEHLRRVFERFYQVDAARSGSAGRGTGLGLAIVKHAVTHLRGAIYIDSSPGRGATVTCVLPQAEETDAGRGEEG